MSSQLRENEGTICVIISEEDPQNIRKIIKLLAQKVSKNFFNMHAMDSLHQTLTVSLPYIYLTLKLEI